MKTTIKSYTPDPMRVVNDAAAICYGKTDYKPERVRRCFERGHMSVFEHASVTFLAEGISRACSHQLVRHRIASYNQTSQRYVKGVPDVVIPETIAEDGVAMYAFTEAVEKCKEAYEIITGCGIPAEDARYVLQNANETGILCTMNMRELFHFLDLRTDSHAQWEIRELAWSVAAELDKIDGYRELIGMWARH